VLPIRLLLVAMEAELLRLNHHARRTVIRVVLGCFAAALLLGALGFAHVAVWCWLRETLPGRSVAAIFAGCDLVMALILAVLASRSVPSRVEREALAVRRRALDDAAASVTISALLLRLFDHVVSRRRPG
jgi:hypothetical protein